MAKKTRLRTQRHEDTTMANETTETLQAAIDALHAIRMPDGDYVYYEQGTHQHYRVTEIDMEDLGDRLIARMPDAYSLWCAETMATPVTEDGEEIGTFTMMIDGGEGGSEVIKAASIKQALEKALAWAREGDWNNALQYARRTGKSVSALVQVARGGTGLPSWQDQSDAQKYLEQEITVAEDDGKPARD